MTEAEFLAAIGANPANRAILERLPAQALPDAWLVSGALFQTVWNVRTGRPAEYGIKDYDIFYFDPDTSFAAEDEAIRRANALFADLAATVEVRNQARVHLWYEDKFSRSYSPLVRATDGIDRFLMPCAQIGLQPCGNALHAYAPNGFSDLAEMIVRPNRTANFDSSRYLDKARRWQSLWPEITVLQPDP